MTTLDEAISSQSTPAQIGHNLKQILTFSPLTTCEETQNILHFSQANT